MYVSCLLIDVGDNPDRPRPGRFWLRNRYHVHQRLCMAFPSDPRKKNDPEFLAPYKSMDFPEQRHLADKKKQEVDNGTLKQVHSPRNEESGFLFRIDPLPNGRAMILVLSAVGPDWEYAFQNANFLLAARPQEPVPLSVNVKPGEQVGFLLVANPTKKILTIPKKQWNAKSQEEQNEKKTRHGKRVPVPEDQLIDWLDCRAQAAGFSLDKDATVVQPGYAYFNKDGEGQWKRLRSARYKGILTVEDAVRFKEALIRGIGSGKAFGFGLLSISPANTAGSGEAK